MKQADYEKEMFEAFIATPAKFAWYQKAFDHFDKREEIEAIIPEDEKRIIIMQAKVGGINRWAIPMAVFALVSLILIIAGLMSMVPQKP